VQALLERTLGADRSRERIDALLARLAEDVDAEPQPPRRPSSHPPPRVGRHVRWAPPPQAPVPKVPSVRDTLIGPTVVPEQPAAKDDAESASGATTQREMLAAAPSTQTDASDAFSGDDTQPSYSHAPMNDALAGLAAPVHEEPIDQEAAAKEHRSQMKKLLEQDLDPNDFQHDPNAPESRPAAARGAPASADDELELLIEDDELLEIADDDLEIIDEEQ
jgi:hypothetical protein